MKVKALPMLAGVAGTMFIAAGASAEFDAIEVTVDPSSPAGLLTTHVWATGNVAVGDTLLSTGFSSIDVFGTIFYQDAFGGNFAPNAAFFPAFPLLQYDTFVTFNRLTSTDDTTGGDPDFTMSDTHIGGGWFWIPGNGQGDAVSVPELGGAAGTLIAQITLVSPPGPVQHGYSGSLTMFTSAGDGGSPDGVNVEFSFVVPAPGAMALLGLAGLAGTRRRRRN